jgi:hypothetical protein
VIIRLAREVGRAGGWVYEEVARYSLDWRALTSLEPRGLYQYNATHSTTLVTRNSVHIHGSSLALSIDSAFSESYIFDYGVSNIVTLQLPRPYSGCLVHSKDQPHYPTYSDIMSTSSDLDVLLSMGFDPERAKLAVKKTGGCKNRLAILEWPTDQLTNHPVQGAIDWLEETQDKTLEEITAAPESAATKYENDPTGEPPALNEGEVAKSLVCDECGKRFRSEAQASFHAEKSGHTDFSQSTEEIAPLTEEEKKAKLEELRQKLAAKRSQMSEQDLIDKKKNEVCHTLVYQGSLVILI